MTLSQEPGAVMLPPSDDEMIKSCLSIKLSVTFILSVAGLDSHFNILIKFSLLSSLSLGRNQLSDVEFL